MCRHITRITTAIAAMLLCALWAIAQTAPPERPRTPAEARAARLAEQRQELEAELVQGLPAIDVLIASGKPEDQRTGLQALSAAAKKFERAGGPDHRIQSRLGQLANIDGRPTKALEFVAPFTQSRDDFQLARTDCWLVVAQAKLLLAGFKPNYDNSAMSMEDLHLFTLPIDPKPVTPKLNEKQHTLAQEALVIADWLAGQTNGLNQMEAVEVCARVLVVPA